MKMEFESFSKEEKAKIFDKMIAYVKKDSTDDDLYSRCRISSSIFCNEIEKKQKI